MRRLSRRLSTAQPGCRGCRQAQAQLPQPHVQVLQDVQAMALWQDLQGITQFVAETAAGKACRLPCSSNTLRCLPATAICVDIAPII